MGKAWWWDKVAVWWDRDPIVTVREVPVPDIPVRCRATVDFRATVILTEDMMGALDALAGYGDDAFLMVFKERLGKSYMEPHEKGLRLFFAAIREQVLPPLADAQAARRDLYEAQRRRDEARELRMKEKDHE